MSDSADYRLLTPPNPTPVMDGSVGWSSRTIDYAAHPAYAAFVAGSGLAEKASATVFFLRSFLQVLVKRAIRYEMIPAEIRSPAGLRGWMRFSGQALRNALRLNAAPKIETSAGAAERIFESLRETGCATIEIKPEEFAKIAAAAQGRFEALKARRGSHSQGGREFDESRDAARRDQDPEIYSALDAALASSGVLAAVSRYCGRQVQLVDANPQINDPSDDFWRTIFPDLDRSSLPSAAYFHRDASGGDLKAIFYMTDVGPQNGPFTYVLGSNHLRLKRLDDFICEANDSNGLSGTTPKARKRFAALPRLFRQKGSFGNDLPEDAPLSRQIADSQWPITGRKGSIVLFDTKGTHRGGMVLEGERRVITCVLG